MTIQKRLVERFFNRLTPHPAASHVKGRGVRWGLARHIGARHVFQRDLKDFFPSVPRHRIEEGLRRLGVSEETVPLLTGLVGYGEGLPQGAPTSPAVGDIVLFPLDVRIQGLVDGQSLSYTRYMDDLTISGRRLKNRVVGRLDDIVADCGWSLNETKGGVFGPGDRHAMLGAVVNEKANAPKIYFRQVRSFLRAVAKGNREPTAEELHSVESKALWIATLNPDRADALIELLQRAVARRA